MAGQITVGGLSTGIAGVKTIGPLTIVGTGTVGATIELNLASGDNNVTVPPNAIAVVIEPPGTNTQALKFRTNLNSGDTGLPISATDPFGPFSFRGLSPTTLILNAGGTVNGVALTFI